MAFLRCSKGVAGSLKREVWLYDKVNKQIFIEKLETVDCITLVCPFEDVDDMCNQFAETFLELASECISRQLLLDLMTNRGSPDKSGNKYVSGTNSAKKC